MESMKAFWDYLIDTLYNFVIVFVVDFMEMGKDLIFWTVEQIIGAMGWAMSLVSDGLPDMDTTGMWKDTPTQVLQVLTYLDFHVCVGIVIAAIGIRFTLNFIPFVK